jgi:hypothetical protein
MPEMPPVERKGGQLIVRSPAANSFQCTESDCTTTFTVDKTESLKKHMKTAHNKRIRSVIFVCDVCDQTFRNEEGLRDHALQHQEQEGGKGNGVMLPRSTAGSRKEDIYRQISG